MSVTVHRRFGSGRLYRPTHELPVSFANSLVTRVGLSYNPAGYPVDRVVGLLFAIASGDRARYKES